VRLTLETTWTRLLRRPPGEPVHTRLPGAGEARTVPLYEVSCEQRSAPMRCV
jgi:hypothetical protein